MSEIAANSGDVAQQPNQTAPEGNASENLSTDNSQKQTTGEQMQPDSPEKVTRESMNDYSPGEIEEQKIVEHKEEKPKPKPAKKEFGPDNPPSLADILEDDDEPEEKPKEAKPEPQEKPKEAPVKEEPTKEETTKEEPVKEEAKEPTTENTEQAEEAPKEETPKEQTTTEEAPEEKPKEETPKERHRITERLIKSFPDKEFASDDEAFDHAIEYLDHLEDYQKRNNETNEKLYDMFDKNPELVAFVGDIINGAPIVAALARNFDLNDIEPQMGDPDYEAWDKAKKERESKLSERKKTMEMLEKNKIASQKEINDFIKESKLSEEEANDFLQKVDEALNPLTKGLVGKDFLKMMRKALSHEKEVENAAKAAEIKTKNEKIVAERVKKSQSQGDGLPHVQSQGTPLDGAARSSEDDLFDAIDRLNGREQAVYQKKR